MEDKVYNHERRIAKIEEECKSLWHRTDEHSAVIESIRDIVVEVREMTVELKQMREDMKAMNERVYSIENIPSKRWNGIVEKVLTALAGALAGYIMFKLGLGG